jgi:hypothetical protein
MADDGGRPARTDHLLDEGHRRGIGSKAVGVRHAPGQHERVEVGRPGVAGDEIHGEPVGTVEVPRELDLPGLDSHQPRRGAAGLDVILRPPQLGLLDALVRHDEGHGDPL